MRTKKSKVTLTKKNATAKKKTATKKKTTTKKLKKYAAGGKSSNCPPQKCGETEYWSRTACRCIDLFSTESLWYPPSGNDAMFRETPNSYKNEETPKKPVPKVKIKDSIKNKAKTLPTVTVTGKKKKNILSNKTVTGLFFKNRRNK